MDRSMRGGRGPRLSPWGRAVAWGVAAALLGAAALLEWLL